MFPLTNKMEYEHRKRKRELEISIIIDTIKHYLYCKNAYNDNKFNILEFGCGDGFQISFLNKLGNLTVCDIYKSINVQKMIDVKFIQCGITKTPFEDNHFDLIFSNHVIEHIEEIEVAASEMIRIGKHDCLFAFSVPTRMWLMLSIPAQYYMRFNAIAQKLLHKTWKIKDVNVLIEKNEYFKKEQHMMVKKLYQKLLPGGHGIYQKFFEAYRYFGKNSWKRFFHLHGFIIIEIKPLLLYGPSEWPIIPTNKLFAKYGICSSRLFILKPNSGNTRK